MKEIRSFCLRAGIALSAAGASLFAFPAAAEAAPANGTYNGSCGSGYGVVDSLDISGYGRAFLTWNKSNGYNCVVTQKYGANDNSNELYFMTAWIQRTADGFEEEDRNLYRHYAGPVYVDGRATCINWGGYVDPAPTGSYQFRSHCG
ncbi:spore-associated protein A [Streptomyces goshikiensis]|uniref:spore-associated protein A n=1 Tax=Streptomyces goshikiensis TaxID=1942 RepID=UPI0033316D2F